MIPLEELKQIYLEACELELQAFKPGNVSVYAEGHDMTVEDFRHSAQASVEPLCSLDYGLGEAIYHAVAATRNAVGCNTNLGILLLSAPLIKAAANLDQGQNLRQALSQTLAATTVADAYWVFKAVTLAAPGGLGESSDQDVRETPTVTLLKAMEIASERDRIAYQYVSGYKDIFDFAVLRYNTWLSQWKDKTWTTVYLYADLLSQFPDSHIERKFGNKYTDFVKSRMRQFLEEFSLAKDPEVIKPALHNLDAELKSIGVNPGTTADMTVATILTVLIEDWIKSRKF